MKQDILIVVKERHHADCPTRELNIDKRRRVVFSDMAHAPRGVRFKLILFYGPWFEHPRADEMRDHALAYAERDALVLGLP